MMASGGYSDHASGHIVRLHTHYDNLRHAEEAVTYLGFRLIRPPKPVHTGEETITTNLNRGNTSPK
jgi:hypothetical protein